jgi:hypothetical protein
MTLKAIETRYKGYRFRSRLEARWAVFFDTLGIPYRYEPEGYDLDGLLYLPDFYLPKHKYYLEVKPELPPQADPEQTTEKVARLTRRGDQRGDKPSFFVFVLWGEVGHPSPENLYNDVAVGGPPIGNCGISQFGGHYWQHGFCWIDCPFCGSVHVSPNGSLLWFGYCDQHPMTLEVARYFWRDRWVDETIRYILEYKMGGEDILKPYREMTERGESGYRLDEIIPEGTAGFPYYPPKWSDLMRSLSVPPSKRLRTAYAAARAARFEHGEKPE